MKYSKMNYQPKNPKQFVRWLFTRLREDKSFREETSYLRLVKDFGSFALFECAYGKFYVSKERRVLSKAFF